MWLSLFILFVSLFFGMTKAEGLCLYPNDMENWNFGCAKTPGLIDRKRPHISNIGSFTIDQSREFSRQPKSNSPCRLGINMDTAWQRVLQSSPVLSAVQCEISATNGDIWQATLKPNPLLEVEAENLGISGCRKDTEPPQTTVVVSQLFELGGKRKARWQVASCGKGIAFWDLQIVRQDLRLQVTQALIAASAAQENFKFAQQKREVVETMADCVSDFVQGGKFSPIQHLKAQITLKEACLDERTAFATWEESKKALSLLWGAPCPDFDAVDFDFYMLSHPRCQEETLAGLYLTPDYGKAQQGVRYASRILKREKMNSIPDIVLSGGVRWFNDSGAIGWVVGAEMPIPFFDPNSGNIHRAHAEVGQANFRLEESVRLLQENIVMAYEHYQTAYEESLLIGNGLLEDAHKAFQWTQECYQGGKVNYLELLEAQKLVLEVQKKYVDVLLEYHMHQAELARLTGEYNDYN